MPFNLFRKRKKEEPKKEEKSTLLNLCEKHFPKNSNEIYEEMLYLFSSNLKNSSENSYTDVKSKARQLESDGKLIEACNMYRRVAQMSYCYGTAEELKDSLQRRKELLSRLSPEEKSPSKVVLPWMIYETILSNYQISWQIAQEHYKLEPPKPVEKEKNKISLIS